jgi:GH43 family beta-xylosidase
MNAQPSPTRTYTNPVYHRDFPDPFVLRFNGRYYAYGTSPHPVTAPGQPVFPMLSSTNLVDWQEEGHALAALDLRGADAYWAPEVAYHNGRFYLYYAVGNGANPNHHLRVAIADHPLGPWTDSGRNLTPHEIFAIDAHPFQDPADGRWYLYYARDSLNPPFAGTGLAVDELVDMRALAGAPREVLRPFAEWQVFELHRAIKQHLDWYTIEGPFVLRVGGRYVAFYSGGRWENPNYGVSYALANHPLGPWTEDAGADGPPILRTIPGQVIGPGHNCVVLGPDLRTTYLVYHGWDPDGAGRYPRIDPVWFVDGRPHSHAPTYNPQPAPPLPDLLCFFAEGLPEPCEATGNWRLTNVGITATSPKSRLTPRLPLGDFVAETSVRSRDNGRGYGFALGDLRITVDERWLSAGETQVPLPDGFNHAAWHGLLLRREGDRVTVTLDQYPTLTIAEASRGDRLSLTGGTGAEFSHLALTRLQG